MSGPRKRGSGVEEMDEWRRFEARGGRQVEEQEEVD
jgi:hypothetical protein